MTFIAAVRSADGAVTPTGAVQFFDGGALLATVPLDRAKGDIAASFTTDGLGLGTHLMLAVYSGDSTVTGSASNLLPEMIYQGDKPSKVTATVTLTPTSSTRGEPVVLTASLKVSGNQTPTGIVQFFSDGIAIGSAQVTGTKKSIEANLSYTGLALGAHSITAIYLGDANVDAAASPAITVLVR